MGIKARLVQAGASATIVAAGSLAYYFEGERRETYVDPVGVLTACMGDTQNVKLGALYIEQECTIRFIDGLKHAEAVVNRCTPNVPEVSKPALISFVFNVGSGNYCKSTLARKANAGDMVGACKQMYRWVFAGGRDCRVASNNCPGIVTRRDIEARACLEGALQ